MSGCDSRGWGALTSPRIGWHQAHHPPRALSQHCFCFVSPSCCLSQTPLPRAVPYLRSWPSCPCQLTSSPRWCFVGSSPKCTLIPTLVSGVPSLGFRLRQACCGFTPSDMCRPRSRCKHSSQRKDPSRKAGLCVRPSAWVGLGCVCAAGIVQKPHGGELGLQLPRPRAETTAAPCTPQGWQQVPVHLGSHEAGGSPCSTRPFCFHSDKDFCLLVLSSRLGSVSRAGLRAGRQCVGMAPTAGWGRRASRGKGCVTRSSCSDSAAL